MKNEKNNPEFVRFSKKFKEARESFGLKWEGNPPSFHEIRSLSARLHSERERFRSEIIGPQIGQYDRQIQRKQK